MSTDLPVEKMTTPNLWQLNSYQKYHGEDTSNTGGELMRRTDTSLTRCEQSNRECAERRQADTFKGEW